MKLFAIICTRDKDLKPVTSELVHTLSSYGVEVKLLVNQESIFSAYQKGLDKCDAKDDDIIIFCHDDIKLLDPKTTFIAALAVCCENETGIVGPAGTTLLGEDSVWWRQDRWQAGYHRGCVKHVSEGKINKTYYGSSGRVVALDGLFLAARKEVWDKVGLEKPSYFEGLWDFYDIHYTTTSHNLKFKNYVINMDIVHHSCGELVGRDSWHKNREAFIEHTELPLSC